MMDTPEARERNYRMVESLRKQNLQEERRLEWHLYSRQGVEATHKINLSNISNEQRKIKEELAKIKQNTTANTYGFLPSRDGQKKEDTHHDKMINSHLPRGFRNRKRRKNKKPGEQNATSNSLPALTQRSFDNLFQAEEAEIHSQAEGSISADNTPREQSKMSANNTTDGAHKARQVSLTEINIEETKAKIAKRLTNHGENGQKGNQSKTTKRLTNQNETNENSQKTNSTKQSKRLHNQNEPRNDEVVSSNENAHTRALSPIDETGDNENNDSKQAVKTKWKKAAKQQLEESKKASDKFDSMKYLPDGNLRTVYKLPEFQSSLREALKARYLRMREKQWYDIELNVNQIFQKDAKLYKTKKK